MKDDMHAENTQELIELLKVAREQDLFQDDEDNPLKDIDEKLFVAHPEDLDKNGKAKAVRTSSVDEDSNQLSFDLKGDEGRLTSVPIDVPGHREESIPEPIREPAQEAFRSSINEDGSLNPDDKALEEFGDLSPEISRIVKSIKYQDEAKEELTAEEIAYEKRKAEILAREKERAAREKEQILKTNRSGKKPLTKRGVSTQNTSRDKVLKHRPEQVKARVKKEALRVNPIIFLPVGIILFVLLVVVIVQLNRPYNMLVNGEAVGIVESQEKGKELIDKATLEASSGYGAEVVFTNDATIEYSKEGVAMKAELTADDQMIYVLKNMITWQTTGYTISIDNRDQTPYLTSEGACSRVLDRVKEYYNKSYGDTSLLHTEFVQKVEILTQTVTSAELSDEDTVYSLLVNGRDPLRQYIVQTGDTLSGIAQANGISTARLKELNPNASEKRLKVGQTLKLNEPEPLLTVKMVANTDVPLIPEGE